MNNIHTNPSPSADAEPARILWLAAGLLGAALAVRLLLFVGYQGHDDRSYIAYAWMFAQGGDIVARQIADPWVGRIGAWLPMSMFMRVFGHGEWVLALWSLLTSLASALLVFVAGYRLFGLRAGVLGACLMVLLPIDVLYGTRAFGDESTGFWCVAALFGFMAALAGGKPAWGLVAGLCWGAAYLGKETAVLMALPFGLILLQRRTFPVRVLGPMAAGLALVVGLELLFWLSSTGDPLYRWHSTLGARGTFVPPPKPVQSLLDLVPSPIPSEVFRSSNTLIDAVLMVATNEEWGFLFYFALPLALLAVARGSDAAKALAIFLLSMLLLLLFLPLHFPHYTLGRDPRHFTMLGAPAVLLLAEWLARLAHAWRRAILAGLALSWAVCLGVGFLSSDVSTQRGLANYLATHNEQRVWTNSIVASDAIVLSGFNPRLNLGIVPMLDGRVIDEPGMRPSNSIRAMRADLPVAQRVSEISGQLVALPDGVRPEPSWILVKEFRPTPNRVANALRGLLLAVGVPARIADKVQSSHGMVIRLFRAVSTA